MPFYVNVFRSFVFILYAFGLYFIFILFYIYFHSDFILFFSMLHSIFVLSPLQIIFLYNDI